MTSQILGPLIDRIQDQTDFTGTPADGDSVVFDAAQEKFVPLESGTIPDPRKEAAANILAGQPVYVTLGNQLALAQADTFAKSQITGLATADTLATFAAPYRLVGKLTLADWTDIVGSTTLTVGSAYYLSAATAGTLTTTPPSTTGHRVVKVGRAIASDTMAIRIDPSVAL